VKHFQAGVLVGLVMLYSPIILAQSPAPIITVQSTEERLERLERRVRSLTEIMLRIDRLQQEMRELRGEVEVQAHAMETLKKRQRDLYLDIDQRLSQQLGSSPPAGGAPAGPAAPPPGQISAPSPPRAETGAPREQTRSPAVRAADTAGEEKAYQRAFDLLKQGRYEESIAAFRRFLEKYPAGNYSDNAQYWLGEASYVSRDFDTALVEFEKVVTMHPYSPKVPGAMLKTGFIYYEQQKWSQARKRLTELTQRYPAATESRLALKRLERMRAAGR
jgi:tol-pal system protein YbgF